jgi:serine/threonine protein kinase
MSSPQVTLGFQAPDIAELIPLFPGYEIQGLIATGGMGAVYRALQKSLDRVVAIKILPKELSRDAAFCAGFEAEAKAMARLNHPNLIGVYDFGEVNGMLFIIMEYVAGKSLYHYAYGKTLDPSEVVRLVTGICHGLAHAHENGIIHRDIKPSNILLDLYSLPKIGDFGLARPVERKIEEGEEIFGTPHYTAPEVVSHPHSVDFRADLFSVGVLLHELLTGKLPADDPRPASLICRCHLRFDEIIRRATNPLPAARYSSATEMANDLLAISPSQGPRVARAGSPSVQRRVQPARAIVQRRSSSNHGPMIALVIFVVLAAAGILYLRDKEPVRMNNRPPAAPAAAQLPEPPAVPSPPSAESARPGELDEEAMKILQQEDPEPKANKAGGAPAEIIMPDIE